MKKIKTPKMSYRGMYAPEKLMTKIRKLASNETRKVNPMIVILLEEAVSRRERTDLSA